VKGGETAAKDKEKAVEEEKEAQNEPGVDQAKSESESTSQFIETGIKDEDKKTTVYHRYYHMFLQGELEALVTRNFEGRLQVIDAYFQHANWIVVCKKVG